MLYTWMELVKSDEINNWESEKWQLHIFTALRTHTYQLFDPKIYPINHIYIYICFQQKYEMKEVKNNVSYWRNVTVNTIIHLILYQFTLDFKLSSRSFPKLEVIPDFIFPARLKLCMFELSLSHLTHYPVRSWNWIMLQTSTYVTLKYSIQKVLYFIK